MAWGGGAADEVWARYYIEHTLHDLYHWAEKHGAKWIASMHARSGARILTATRAERLVTEGGRVVGVRAAGVGDGATTEIRSTTVVVTTGGFNSSLDMVLEARPDLRGVRVMEGSGRGATGSGHALLRELGGHFTHMDAIWFHVYATPDSRDPTGRRGLVFRQTPGYIWVNQQGRRFHDESTTGGASATSALLRQTPPRAWAILDAPSTASMGAGAVQASRHPALYAAGEVWRSGGGPPFPEHERPLA